MRGTDLVPIPCVVPIVVPIRIDGIDALESGYVLAVPRLDENTGLNLTVSPVAV